MRKITPTAQTVLARRFAACKDAGADRWDGKKNQPAKKETR